MTYSLVVDGSLPAGMRDVLRTASTASGFFRSPCRR
jgi:hypothetical protein